MQQSSDTPYRTVVVGSFSIDIATEAGPRILGVTCDGVDAMFVDLPTDELLVPGADPFKFLGGHRLWRAPEDPPITYQPDDGAVSIDVSDSAVTVRCDANRDGLDKTIVLRASGHYLVVDHVVQNVGTEVLFLAPWAITQFRTGGTAYLPHPEPPESAGSVSADRSIVLWPYTGMDDPEISFGDEMVTMFGSDRTGASKVGLRNVRGWIAYHRNGVLFVKWSPRHRADGRYADLNASVQVYRDNRFVELETLGELTEVDAGGSVSHREVWSIQQVGERDLPDIFRSLQSPPIEGSR
jgi:hypothetical protein